MMRKYSLLMLVTLISACAEQGATNSDAPNVVCSAWSQGRMLGTASNDRLLDVLVDDSGEVYLAGFENGTVGQTTVDPSGAARGVLLRLDRQGNVLNRFNLPANGPSSIEALSMNPQTGELAFAGRIHGSLTGTSHGDSFDMLLGWLDIVSWQSQVNQYVDNRPQHPTRIQHGQDGTLVVAGFDDIYVPGNYVEAWENPLLASAIRQGSEYVLSWTLNTETSYTDFYFGLAVDALDGSIYVTGHSDGGAERGMFVKKYDAQGQLLWQRQLSGMVADSGAVIQRLADGHLLFAGSSVLPLGGSSYGGLDGVVLKLDSRNGAVIWGTQFGSSDNDWVTDMTLDRYGNIYLTGETFGALVPGRQNPDRNAVFMVKFDAGGIVVQVEQWNSGAYETATAIAVDACEQVFISGYTKGGLTGSNAGQEDGFVIVHRTR